MYFFFRIILGGRRFSIDLTLHPRTILLYFFLRCIILRIAKQLITIGLNDGAIGLPIPNRRDWFMNLYDIDLATSVGTSTLFLYSLITSTPIIVTSQIVDR